MATAPVTAVSRSERAFVFVFCGGAEHIDTLHYSLAALQRHSRADILVVTDSRRNDRAIQWPRVVDVATPTHLDNHQASVFLKTAVHRFLPPGPRYCYLDTDVVAVHPGVDEVFGFAPAPVRFAADHIALREFSPYAVSCPCLERHRDDQEEINALKRPAHAMLAGKDHEAPRLVLHAVRLRTAGCPPSHALENVPPLGRLTAVAGTTGDLRAPPLDSLLDRVAGRRRLGAGADRQARGVNDRMAP